MFILVSGFLLLLNQELLIGAILVIIGAVFTFWGIRGRKVKLQEVLETLDVLDGIRLVFDVISEIDF